MTSTFSDYTTKAGDKLESFAADKIADKAGEFLGLDMDRNAASALHSLLNRFVIPPVRRKAEDITRIGTEQLFKALGKEDKIPQAQKVLAKVIGYGITAFPQIVSFWDSTREAYRQLARMGSDTASVHKESKKDNFILSELRSETYGEIRSMYAQNVVGIINLLPNAISKYYEDQINEAYKPIKDEVDAQWETYKKANPRRAFSDWDEDRFRNEVIEDLEETGRFKEDFERYAWVEKSVAGKKEPIEQYGTLLMPFVTNQVQKMLGRKHAARDSSERLFSMIGELAAEIRKNPEGQQFRMAGEYVTLPEAIELLFKETHARRYGKGGGDLPPSRLGEISEQIANAITYDKLNPMALVDLIGRKNIVLNKNGELASEEQADKAIDDVITLYAKQKPLDAAAYYKDSELTKEMLKQLFEDSKDNKQDLAVLASMFPVNVTMEATGMKRNQVRGLLRRAHHQYYSTIERSVLTLANMPDEELKKFKLTNKEIAELKTIAVKVDEAGRDAVDKAVGAESKPGVERIVAKAIAHGAELPWTERVRGQRGARGRATDMDEESLEGMESFRASTEDLSDDTTRRKAIRKRGSHSSEAERGSSPTGMERK